jgi:hypothetical protein
VFFRRQHWTQCAPHHPGLESIEVADQGSCSKTRS